MHHSKLLINRLFQRDSFSPDVIYCINLKNRVIYNNPRQYNQSDHSHNIYYTAPELYKEQSAGSLPKELIQQVDMQPQLTLIQTQKGHWQKHLMVYTMHSNPGL